MECEHCHQPIAIRNPSGYCDHLFYPENCDVCNEENKEKLIAGEEITAEIKITKDGQVQFQRK